MAARATQSLSIVSPASSPEERERQKRKNLADTMKALSRAEAKERQVPEAVERARAQVDLAGRTLDLAKEAVEDARKGQEARFVEAAKSGEEIAPDTTLREARAAEQEAQDQFDAATAALRVIEVAEGGGELHERQRLRQEKYERAAIAASMHGTDRDVETVLLRGEEVVGSDPSRETAEARARVDLYVGSVMWTKAPSLLERAEELPAELIESMVGLR